MKKLTVLLLISPFLVACGTQASADDQQDFLTLHNETRAAGATCGDNKMSPAPPLSWNDRLATIAQAHAERMAAAEQTDHNLGGSAEQRLAQGGYKWMVYAENLASGITNQPALLKAWLQSPKHCENIMNPNVTDFAVAEQDGYWIAIFAAPEPD